MISPIVFAHHYRRFEAACASPLEAQAKRLRSILNDAAETTIGRENGFRQIARIGDARRLTSAFQESVPIRSYREMREDLDAVYNGDWRRLCPSRPLFFSMTAGSTGAFKYIPVTAEFRLELSRGSMVFCGAMEAACSDMRGHAMQFLVGSAEGGITPSGVPAGFASGFNYKNFPRIVRSRFPLPYWIFTLEEADDRAYAAGRVLVDCPDVATLAAISPVNLINMRNALESNVRRLIDDVERGTLTLRGDSVVKGSYRVRPNRARAAVLRAAWLREGRLPGQLLFPALKTLVCWQGGNMGYYLKELDEAFGALQRFEFPISASEGVFAIPCEINTPGGALAVTCHFLEFIPDGANRSCAVRIDQLETGCEYCVVVTNGSGLYRYDMEDIVRVTGRFRNTPVIEFVSKKERQVSVSNERINELDVTTAMTAASLSAGEWFREFLFVPCTDRRYRVLLDDDGRCDSGMHAFARELERQLRQHAKGYDFEREDALLEPLQIVRTGPGELRSYFARRQAHPVPSAQVKPMHLTNEFDAHRFFNITGTYAA